MSLPETQINEVEFSDRIVLIETISNVDALFEDLLNKDKDHEDVRDERIPYWADLWPSAIGLCHFMLSNDSIASGMKVLELGCGVGLPGIVAGQQGAHVIFSDYIQDALNLAERNWKLNKGTNAEFRLLDWRELNPDMNVDTVLASDIAYEKKSFTDLLHAFKLILKPGGKILIAEPNRAFAQSFFLDLAQQGFLVHTQSERIEFRDQAYSIHVHEITSVEP